jgi:hypothetical protein
LLANHAFRVYHRRKVKAFNQAALLIAMLAGIGALVRKDPMPSIVRLVPKDAPGEVAAPCPPGTLPDNGVCIPVAKTDRASTEKRPRPASSAGSDDLPSLLQEGILRWPERPVRYDAYRLPVEGPQITVKGLGEPDSTSFAVLISGPLGSNVVSPTLEGQTENAKVLFADPSAGKLITLHDVNQNGHAYRYLLLYNLLDKLDPSLSPDTTIEPSKTLGVLRGAALQLAAFRLRPENQSEIDTTDATRWITPRYSVPCDLRNILALK